MGPVAELELVKLVPVVELVVASLHLAACCLEAFGLFSSYLN